MEASNAERFLTAYNNIDYSLRSIYGFKRSMSFSDVIRRSVVLNSVVRKYEDDLIDYGRLRNAIIHQGNHKFIIAEPHDDIVEHIERLANLITEPPLALDMVGNKEVITIPHNISLNEAVELIYRTGYGNLPVYKGEKIIGVLHARKLINTIGEKISQGVDIDTFLKETTADDVLAHFDGDYYFMLADQKLTIDAAMNFFENNRKLLIILITKDGKDTGKPLKIISSADIIDMKRILDVY